MGVILTSQGAPNKQKQSKNKTVTKQNNTQTKTTHKQNTHLIDKGRKNYENIMQEQNISTNR